MKLIVGQAVKAICMSKPVAILRVDCIIDNKAVLKGNGKAVICGAYYRDSLTIFEGISQFPQTTEFYPRDIYNEDLMERRFNQRLDQESAQSNF